jgi:hypothetical protein
MMEQIMDMIQFTVLTMVCDAYAVRPMANTLLKVEMTITGTLKYFI